MSELEKILANLVEGGFSFRNFPAYERHVGVEKNRYVALLEMTEDAKLKQFSSSGYLLDSGEIGLLVQKQGRSLFVWKTQEILADGELLEGYQKFTRELASILNPE